MSIPSLHPIDIQSGLLVVRGYGIHIHVERGQLVVEDGIADDRRRVCISRVTPELRRLVVLGHAGTVSLDAQKWLHAVGISYVHLDGDGEVLAVGTARALDDVKVLRGQALAPFNGVGLTVAGELLKAKLEGQARVAARLKGVGAVSILREALALLPDARTVEDQRFIESRGAAAYWDAWTGTPVHFVPKDVARVPAHWRMFDSRRSILSRSPRKSTNPVNALLNYLYAILEAEATIASRSVGLDPRLGVLHVDSNRRDSFACDLMEAVRPQVDAYVLDLLTKRTFLRTDLFETGDGCCRLLPTLTKPLAATAPRWAKLLAPFAERAAGLFAGSGQQAPLTTSTAPMVSSVAFRTPLTQANRARQHQRKKDVVGAHCRGCGTDLGTLERSHCASCRALAVAGPAERGRFALAAQRYAGIDGRSSVSARAKHRQAATRHNQGIAEWESKNVDPPDASLYERDIAPRLREVPTHLLVQMTGLSTIYCRQIRTGKRVPHARYWDVLAAIGKEHGEMVPAHWDTAFYLQEIVPGLCTISVKALAEATGLSESYCKRIRRGVRMPQRRHWKSMLAITSRITIGRDKA